VHTLKGHSRWVLAVSYSPDGSLLASGGYDNEVRIWDPNTGKQIGIALKGHYKGLRKGCRYLVTGLYSMKKLLYARVEFIYVWWCCVREASSNSQNAEEALRVLPRNTTLTRL
jgi:WD40 repeat protein